MIDLFIEVAPAPIVEIVIELFDLASNILRGLNDWLGDLVGQYTYN